MFRRATEAGTLNEFFANRPTTASAFQQKITTTNPNPSQMRAQRSAERGGFNYGTVTAPALAPSGAPAPVGGTGAKPLSLEELINTFSGGGSVTNDSRRYIDAQLNRLTQTPNMPSFEDMFGRYLKTANTELDRQVAGLREAFGSSGARYSTDLMRGEGDLRTQFGDKILTKADELMMGLEGLRGSEFGTAMQGRLSLDQLEQQRRQDAMNRMFLDMVRSGQLPPALAASLQTGAGFGAPDTLAYTR